MEKILFIVASIIFVLIRIKFHQSEQTDLQEVSSTRERGVVLLFSTSLLVTHLWWIVNIESTHTLTISQLVGACLMLGSLPLLFWVHHSLGIYFSARLVLQKDHQIIRTGPYQWVRHPMYSVGFLYLIGAGLLSNSLLVLIVPTGCFALLVAVRIRDEETMLESVSPEYKQYQLTTGRFIPKIWQVK